MHREHFHLTGQPFSLVPRASGSIMVPGFKRELDRCLAAIDDSRCPVLLTGPAGCGKTTLLSLVESRFAPSIRTVRLGCASITNRNELFQVLLFENGLPFTTEKLGELRLSLIDFLKSAQHCPEGLLLLVDEAHLLTDDVLEEIRMMSNLVCNGRSQVRVVLAGNLELEELVAHNISLNQRMALRSCLAPYSYNETMLFIMAQVQLAGSDGRRLFLPSSIEKIHTRSGGIPRVICQIADAALRLAAQRKARSVDSQTVEDAWQDLQHLPMAVAESMPVNPAVHGAGQSIIEFGQLSDAPRGSSPASLPVKTPTSPSVNATSPPSIATRGVPLFSPPTPPWQPATPEPGNGGSPVADFPYSVTSTLTVEEPVSALNIQTPEQVTAQLQAEPASQTIENVDATLHSLMRQLDEMQQPVQIKSGIAGLPRSGDTVFAGDDEPYRPVVETIRETVTVHLPVGVDPGELFGSGFEREEDVGPLHLKRVEKQNRNSSGMAVSDIPRLVESDSPPGWVPDGPEVLLSVPASHETTQSPVSIDVAKQLPAESAKAMNSPESQSASADNREIVFVSNPPIASTSQPQTASGPADQPGKAPTARAGQAIRMDYTELFRQLRNAPPGDIDIPRP
jgi:type II secretory pathway predicted ATPase ExeA